MQTYGRSELQSIFSGVQKVDVLVLWGIQMVIGWDFGVFLSFGVGDFFGGSRGK
jgi:hypothetical protein